MEAYMTSERWILLGDLTNSTKTLYELSTRTGSDGQLHFKLMHRYAQTLERIFNYAQTILSSFNLSGAELANTMGDGFVVLGRPEHGLEYTKDQFPDVLRYTRRLKEFADREFEQLKREINNIIVNEQRGSYNQPVFLDTLLKMRMLITHGNVYKPWREKRYIGHALNYGSKIMNLALNKYKDKKVIAIDNLPDHTDGWEEPINKVLNQANLNS